MRKLLLVSVLGLFLLFGLVSPVWAISNPDSISIQSVRVFQNLWETGDMLFLCEYKVMYATDPTEDPKDTFLVGVWDGTTQKYSRPLSYYDHNMQSVYLTAAQALTWEGSYTVRVMGNPSYFATLTKDVNKASLELAPTHWISGAQSASRALLQDWCVSLAETFETS